MGYELGGAQLWNARTSLDEARVDSSDQFLFVSEEGGATMPQDVLVVEDSLIIALDIEETVERFGVASVRVESTVEGALEAIEQKVPDFAIVDYNLGQEESAPVARELAARGVRFVLATGYANAIDQIDDLGAAEVLTKPFGSREIERVLKARE